MTEGCVASCLYDWVYAGCEAGPVVEGEEPGMADTPADNGSTHPHILYCITQRRELAILYCTYRELNGV